MEAVRSSYLALAISSFAPAPSTYLQLQLQSPNYSYQPPHIISTSNKPYPTSIPHTTLSYPLRYAASWTFALYTLPHRLGTLRLARDTLTSSFVVAGFHPHCKQWKPITAFDAAKATVFLSDSQTRVRILGGKDGTRKEELLIYLDLQFGEKADLRAFCEGVLEGGAEWFDGMVSRNDMVQYFRAVPEKPGSTDPDVVKYQPQHAYNSPMWRDYRPEIIRDGSEPVPRINTALNTGGKFDGYTRESNREGKIWVQLELRKRELTDPSIWAPLFPTAPVAAPSNTESAFVTPGPHQPPPAAAPFQPTRKESETVGLSSQDTRSRDQPLEPPKTLKYSIPSWITSAFGDTTDTESAGSSNRGPLPQHGSKRKASSAAVRPDLSHALKKARIETPSPPPPVKKPLVRLVLYYDSD